MLISFFIVTLCVGVLLVYSTNTHQQFFKNTHAYSVRLLGYGILIIALATSALIFDGGAVVFTWLIGIMLLLITFPFIALFLGHCDAKK